MKKIKIKYLVLVLAICTIYSCDKIKELATVSINTKLETQFPVVVSPTGFNSDLTKSSGISFNEVSEIKIADNIDLEPYLNKIKTINLSNLEIVVNGLQTNQIIHSITLEINDFGVIATVANITQFNNSYKPAISSLLIDKVAETLLKEKKITVKVYGSVSSPLVVTVDIKMDAKVVAYVLK